MCSPPVNVAKILKRKNKVSVSTALNVVSRLDMQPSLVSVFALNNLTAAIQELARADAVDMVEVEQAARSELASAYGYTTHADDKPFVFIDGIAIIPVHGMLINRFGRSWGYVTGYNFVRAQTQAAEADEEVLGIVYDVHSYGGEAAGCFETSREMAAVTKPTLAVIDSAAYSGGYALASACKRVVVTPSGGVGSIGVICTHWSYQKMLDAAGVKVTLIYSGEHKADANPYEDLPDDVRRKVKKDVDVRRKEFATLVAENRGLEVQAIMDTEAESFRSEEALSLGLVDAIETPVSAVMAFLNELSGSTTEEEDDMSTQATATPSAESQKSNPGADTSAAATPAVNSTAERQAERTRISSIMGCEEAANKQKLASTLALSTEMSLEEAKVVLAAAAAENAAPGKDTPVVSADPLQTLMNTTANPNVGADSQKTPGTDSELTMAEQIIRDQQLATGVKLN